jgi:succinate dehydrogenase / fumarate reductase cytochrome b subunit
MSATAVLPKRFTATIAQELVVALTGVALVLFILSHLGANLLIYLGPAWLNAYSEHLRSYGPLLVLARIGLATAFVLHIGFAIKLAIENRKARPQRYAVDTRLGQKGAATRYMALSGITLACFLVLHLSDFTLRSHEGPNTVVGTEHLALYGLVWNFFGNPLRVLVYIVAMCALGLHLSHALSSVIVTLGVLTDRATRGAETFAKVVGLVVALGFSSIPLYVLLMTHLSGGPAL